MGSDVLPALREIGEEFDLRDPFEIDAAVSSQFLEPSRIPEGAPA